MFIGSLSECLLEDKMQSVFLQPSELAVDCLAVCLASFLHCEVSAAPSSPSRLFLCACDKDEWAIPSTSHASGCDRLQESLQSSGSLLLSPLVLQLSME